MAFKLLFTEEAARNLLTLESDNSKYKQLKAVYKSLGYLEANPKHPSLNTHEYTSLTRQSEITIIAITPHP